MGGRRLGSVVAVGPAGSLFPLALSGEELPAPPACRQSSAWRTRRGVYPPPPQVEGSGSDARGNVVKSTLSCEDSTTVTPSGKLRFRPST